jgi:membrane peptidoglycan carboxypeptidase
MVCGEFPPLRRTVRELRLANAIDRQFERTQILTIYLNSVYWGAGMYGIQNAANHYFGKHPSDLSVSEAALLAALIATPNRFSPITHPERALERRNLVIDGMTAKGIVSPESANEAKATGLSLRPGLN